MREKIKIFLLAWTFGIVGGLIFSVLRLTGRVKVQWYASRKLEPAKKGLLLVSNHPSLFEPFLMPFLFFPRYLFSSRFTSFTVVDRSNYYNGWFSVFRPIFLYVDRGDSRDELRLAKRVVELLQEGRIVILYPEGGRTFKGKEFRFSAKGKKIRALPLGLRRIFKNASPTILPVWVEGADRVLPNSSEFPRFPYFPLPRFWRKTAIRIGNKIRLECELAEESVEVLQDAILKLADEE